MIYPWNEETAAIAAGYINGGGVVVVPTDTIYGLLAKASDIKAVESVYKIKGRTPSKPLIILISKPEELELFGVTTTPEQKKLLSLYWPGKVSIILPCSDNKFKYLHRGTYSLAFRLPHDRLLQSLIEKTGPLIAPSANPEGLTPALTITMAYKYFGKEISMYLDGGERISEPSTLVSILNGEIKVLRGELKTTP